MIVYINDIVNTGNDAQEIINLKQYYPHYFQTKDLGSLGYSLGIEVARFKKGIFLSKYVLDILSRLAC